MAIDARQLKDLILSGGASAVGFADLREIPAEARDGFPMAIVMLLAMDPAVIDGVLDGRRAEFRAEINRTSEILKTIYREVAAVLAADGRLAVRPDELPGYAGRDRLTGRVTYKMAATLAALGWIGKSGMLVTPQYGSAVRLFCLLTDAALPADVPVRQSRCGEKCRVCAEACSAGAIYGELWQAGPTRELLDTKRCGDRGKAMAEQLKINHPTCGTCVAVCPWTRRYTRSARGGNGGK